MPEKRMGFSERYNQFCRLRLLKCCNQYIVSYRWSSLDAIHLNNSPSWRHSRSVVSVSAMTLESRSSSHCFSCELNHIGVAHLISSMFDEIHVEFIPHQNGLWKLRTQQLQQNIGWAVNINSKFKFTAWLSNSNLKFRMSLQLMRTPYSVPSHYYDLVVASLNALKQLEWCTSLNDRCHVHAHGMPSSNIYMAGVIYIWPERQQRQTVIHVAVNTVSPWYLLSARNTRKF